MLIGVPVALPAVPPVYLRANELSIFVELPPPPDVVLEDDEPPPEEHAATSAPARAIAPTLLKAPAALLIFANPMSPPLTERARRIQATCCVGEVSTDATDSHVSWGHRDLLTSA